MSPELRLILAPRATYAALARTPHDVGALTALRRPLLVAIILGVSLAIASTGRATPALVASTTLSWSYVVLLQLAIGLPLIVPAARRTVGVARAIDLFFAGHAPWSLFWLVLAAGAALPRNWPGALVVVGGLIAMALTARIVAAFFAEVLAMDRRAARRLTFAQQSMTWAVFIAANWLASAITPRVLELWR